MATVHYTGTLDDGTEFDSSRGREPLSFRLGCSEVIKGFEEAVQGLTPGQNVKVVIPADEAYGPRREDMVVSIPRGQYPDGMPQELGTTIGLRTPDGMEIPATIVEFSDENVILDANHPLAGERLTFDIELVSLEN
ncbi:MAG: peptidylprolyl isomerase [Deltaproteobacteria bacterium]|nr:peptidylprolyl isomerase [Deltaproteobacteria bacterium]